MTKPVSETQRRCFDLHQQGLSLRQIADATNRRSTSAVRANIDRARRNLGLPKVGQTRVELNNYAAKVVGMYEHGKTVPEIAAELGRHREAIRSLLQRKNTPKALPEHQPEPAKKILRYQDADVRNDRSHFVLIRVPNDVDDVGFI